MKEAKRKRRVQNSPKMMRMLQCLSKFGAAAKFGLALAHKTVRVEAQLFPTQVMRRQELKATEHKNDIFLPMSSKTYERELAECCFL